MFDVIVIGGGPAGVVAALRARELGAMVALVERGQLGGSCVNDGCVPMRVLAKAARLTRSAAQFADYGLVAPLPTVDFAQLMQKTRQVVETVHANKQLVATLQQSGVVVFAGSGNAHFVNEHTIALADGTTLQAEKFILCVGGHARHSAFPGAEHAILSTDIWSLKQLPQSAIVVGGAATGCQLASVLAAFGTQVTLLSTAPRLLPQADETIAYELANAFAQRGIQVITGIDGTAWIEPQHTSWRLWYRADGQLYPIDAEAIFFAIGWPGNTEALNLAAAGVQTEHGYIRVDDHLRTSAPHIFAAGDITGRTMLVQSADHQARMAAENAVLGSDQTFTNNVIPFGGFTDPEYAGVGYTEREARAREECAVTVVPYSELDRAVIDGQTRGCCKLIVSRKTHRLLGAHVVGEQALEVVQLVAASMKAGARVETLARLKIAYPTFAVIVSIAARRLMRELGMEPVSSYWRDLPHQPVADWERSFVELPPLTMPAL